jgi:hypothetical protein
MQFCCLLPPQLLLLPNATAARAAYLQGRGLTSTDVARATRKLRLYRQLKQLDPLGFLLLCRVDTARFFDTQVGASSKGRADCRF